MTTNLCNLPITLPWLLVRVDAGRGSKSLQGYLLLLAELHVARSRRLPDLVKSLCVTCMRAVPTAVPSA